ncbi:MAG TPA: tetratricopeptide repeat protein, partial [candidate division Zixibacteria bacterium]|nr:tetratricopeptide repeat protein [candidate division Zixibacteria bacterium]
FDGMSLLEIERSLAASEPSKPSSLVTNPDAGDRVRNTHGVEPERLRRQLKGDLDNICLMALRSDPSRRYNSAGQLREDLGRYLKQLPVAARPDTLRYRLQRFTTRHRTMTVTVSASALLAIGLSVFYTWRIVQERDRAQLEARKAAQTAEFVVGLFDAANPNEAQGQEITARELLDQGRARVDDELAGQPELQATMLQVIGRSYGQLGLMAESKSVALDALERLKSAADASVELELLLLNDIGLAYYDFRQTDSALEYYGRALALSQSALGERHIETQNALNNVGATLREMGETDSAVVVLRRALELGRTLPDVDSLDLAHSLNQLGRLLSLHDELEEAEPYLVEGLQIRLAALGEHDFEVCASRGALAGLYRLQGRFDESAKLYLQNVASLRILTGESHHYVGAALNSLAHVMRDSGDFAGADTLYQQSYAILLATLPPRHVNLASALTGMGMLYNETGRYAAADSALSEALA